MLRLARFLKEYKLQMIIGPLGKLVESIFELMIPLVMARIIDVAIPSGDKGYIISLGLIMIGLGVLGFGSAIIGQKSAALASQGSGTKIRNALFEHVNTLSYSDLDKFGTTSLVNRITNDVNQLQLAVAMFIRLIIRSPFLIIGATALAFSINSKITLIFLAAAVLIAAILYVVMTRSVKMYKARQKTLDKLSQITGEGISGVRVIRAFSKQKHEEDRFSMSNESLTRISVRVGILSGLLNPLTYAVINFAIAAVVWLGGDFVYSGDMMPGEIIALVGYLNQILLAMIIVANLIVIFTKAAASAARVNEVFETGSEDKEKTANSGNAEKHANKAENVVEFKDVSFAYNDGKHVLEDISFVLKKGETLGVIGGTGSGKTSLISLIPRFYRANEGQVLVDGVDVNEYSENELRHKCAVVPQRAVLFSGTVAENIRFGKQNANEDEIIESLKAAQAYEFVMNLPGGVNATVSALGSNFSGGQRQRLTIARAVVSDADLLILDDSLSALDFSTDAKLRRALEEYKKESTVIIVSQRVSSIMNADKILVLDDGVMAGLGSHKELFEDCEEYREICLSQMEREEAVL